MKRLCVAIVATLFLLTGCRLGPRYTPPSVEAPLEWKNSQQETCSQPPSNCGSWWEAFNDPTLNYLELQALSNNYSIYSTLEKVVQARAVAGVKKADLYPQVNLLPNYTDTGELFKIYLPGIAANSGTPNLFSNFPTIYRIHMLQYYLPLTMNYELDLWGKIRGQYESAIFDAQSEQEAFKSALLTLTTEVANAYFQLRTLDEQMLILQDQIDNYQDILGLNKSRYDTGVSNEQDVASSEVSLYNAEQAYQDAQRQRGLLEDMIATLIGVPASAISIQPGVFKGAPPTIPAGVPSTVLAQRPDIAQAERKVASEQALIGVAYASFLPSISLTGTLGYSSPDLRQFLSWKSRFWSMGASGAQSVFDGGRNIANLAIAWSSFRMASDDYKQQVLTAFQEVEDALNNVEFNSKQYQSFKLAQEAAFKVANLSVARYKSGLVNYLEVQVNENNELTARLNTAAMLGQQYLSTVQLIKALGGTWANEP